MDVSQGGSGYKVSFKNCPIEDRKSFKESNCIMPISVGQPVHDGIKFQNTLEYIADCFDSYCILVDDTIQKYTLAIVNKKTPESCYAQSKLNGDRWLLSNMHLFSQDKYKKLKIVRWNYWLNNPKFYFQYEVVSTVYTEDSFVRDAFAFTIEEFLSRLKVNSEIHDENRAFNLCVEYLKEECAVMCLWAESSFKFEVYPYGRNSAMQAIYEKIIQPQYPGLLKSVSLRFKKRSAFNESCVHAV